MASRLILPVAFILCLGIMWSIWDGGGETAPPERGKAFTSVDLERAGSWPGERARVRPQDKRPQDKRPQYRAGQGRSERAAGERPEDEQAFLDGMEALEVFEGESLEGLTPLDESAESEAADREQQRLGEAFTGTVASGGSGNTQLAALPSGQPALLPFAEGDLSDSGSQDTAESFTEQERDPGEIPQASPQDIARAQELVTKARAAYWKDVANGGNFIESYEMLLEAVELGAPEAHARIAELEYWGLGDVPRDQEAARRRHEDGARAGDPMAMCHHAKNLESAGNQHAGTRWLEEAATGGNIHAIRDLERKSGKFPDFQN